MGKRNRKNPTPGSMDELAERVIFKGKSRDKLQGFYRTPGKRRVFVPLGTRTRFFRPA
jgi:hypothetical protein